MESNRNDAGCDATKAMTPMRQDVDGILRDLAELTGVQNDAGLQPQLRKVRDLVLRYKARLTRDACELLGLNGWDDRTPLPMLATLIDLEEETRNLKMKLHIDAIREILPEDRRVEVDGMEYAGAFERVAEYARGLRHEAEARTGSESPLVVSHEDRVTCVRYLQARFEAFKGREPSDVNVSEIIEKLRGATTWGQVQGRARDELEAWWRGVASRVSVGVGLTSVASRSELDAEIDKLIGALETYREESAIACACLGDMLGISRRDAHGAPSGVAGLAWQVETMVGRLVRGAATLRAALGPGTEADPNEIGMEYEAELSETIRRHSTDLTEYRLPPGTVLGFLLTRCCDRLLARLRADGRNTDDLPMNLERLVAEVCDGGEAIEEGGEASKEAEGGEA